ncbi:unnamed protein product, partial [Sphacelaria rigidula]
MKRLLLAILAKTNPSVRISSSSLCSTFLISIYVTILPPKTMHFLGGGYRRRYLSLVAMTLLSMVLTGFPPCMIFARARFLSILVIAAPTLPNVSRNATAFLAISSWNSCRFLFKFIYS